jgi:glycosyltransferase involved in cell wall biosynthesis
MSHAPGKSQQQLVLSPGREGSGGGAIVSVIIIFLNPMPFFEEAVESVLAQTYPHWELLLVDDGSTDGSPALARKYVERFPGRARYLEHARHENRGMIASRNLGIRHARGAYIAFLDADDLWLPHKLERQVAILESQPEAAMLYGQTLRWHSWTREPKDAEGDFLMDLGVALDSLVEPPTIALRVLEKSSRAPSMSSAIFRRPVVEAVGGFEDTFRDIYEDQVFCMKVALKAPIYVASECWDRYRQHSANSLSKALQAGQYHPADPSPKRAKFLGWMRAYLLQQGMKNTEVWDVLEDKLRPYRHLALRRLWRAVEPSINGFRGRSQNARLSLSKLRRRIFRESAGSITADPNPIKTDPSGTGLTTLSWQADRAAAVEVHVDAPDGPMFSGAGCAGTATTGNWVRPGMVFYLQDVTGGLPLSAANTLDSVTIRAQSRPEICPLAVFAPYIGVLSESFIRRHMQELLPGGVAVITESDDEPYTGHWRVDAPVCVLSKIRQAASNKWASRITPHISDNRANNESIRRAKQFLKEHQVQALLGEYLHESLPWLEIARELKIRFFAHAHGYDVSQLLREPKWRDLYRKYNQADGVITMSHVNRARLIDLGLDPDKAHVIPYGVDVPEAYVSRPERERVRCVAVGRMVAKKGPILTLDAFRRAVEAFPHLRLDYVGDGAMLPAARQLVRAFNLESVVTLHGAQSGEVVDRLMREADIFLQHSLTDPETGDEEGLPVAILEAMARGLPVVSTRHAGIPEAVTDAVTGHLVEEGDTVSMAQRLLALARDAGLRRRLGEAGWRRAKENFSWERERKDLLKLLQVGEPI